MDNHAVDEENVMDLDQSFEAPNAVETDDRSRSPVLFPLSQRNYRALQSVEASESNNQSSQPISEVSEQNNEALQTETNHQISESDVDKKRLCLDESDDDGQLCPICFDVWSDSGDHRLCSLRCGHLFGHSCLRRWLSSEKTCPTCKSRVRGQDVRFIYARKLMSLDNSQLVAVQTELEIEKCEKNRLLTELVHYRERERSLKRENMKLQAEINQMKYSALKRTETNSTKDISISKIYREKTLEISKTGGCRVIDYYKNSNLITVSAPSNNPLFAGYGIRKISTQDFRCIGFVPLHSNTIRDLSFHPEKELLLSAATDKLVKLTDTATNTSISSINCNSAVWSCCWDSTNSNCFYVGEQMGSVRKYDMRKTDETIFTYKIPGDLSPVISVISLGWCPGGALPKGGVLICKLNSCWAFEYIDQTEPIRHPLPLEGPFLSMRYDRAFNNLLVSSRPNARHSTARHCFCSLDREGDDNNGLLVCNTLHTFLGSPVQNLLSKSCLMNVGGEVLVAANQEYKKVVDVWNVGTTAKINSLSVQSPVLDLCPVLTNSAAYLCALNENKLDFFKVEF